MQNCRPVLQERHDERFHVKVIAEQLELGNVLARPIDAIETGQRNPLALDPQNQIALGLLEREKFFGRNAPALGLARAFDLGRLGRDRVLFVRNHVFWRILALNSQRLAVRAWTLSRLMNNIELPSTMFTLRRAFRLK